MKGESVHTHTTWASVGALIPSLFHVRAYMPSSPSPSLMLAPSTPHTQQFGSDIEQEEHGGTTKKKKKKGKAGVMEGKRVRVFLFGGLS